MTDLQKTNINLYDMIKNKEDFKLNIDPNDKSKLTDNEDQSKYFGGNGAMAKLVSFNHRICNE